MDSPEAKENQPTTCVTIEISKEHVNEILTKMENLGHIQSMDQNWECCGQNIHFHHSAGTQMLLGKLVDLFTHNHPDKKSVVKFVNF
nr:AraC family transcriptional regulator N-terminal domain-containing protein [Abyssogena phaseoliformis symbiont]